MKTAPKTRMTRLFAMLLAVCLLAGLLAVPAAAVEANQTITDAKSGVVQIQMWYVDPEVAQSTHFTSGSGFLINNDTVITCHHVVAGMQPWWYVERALATGAALGRERTAEEIINNLQFRVSILRDVSVKATVIQASAEMDYAILKLENPINTRTPLPLRNSNDVKQTETVHALGYPGDMDDILVEHTYDVEQVTITTGSVNTVDKVSVDFEEWYSEIDPGEDYDNVTAVVHDAIIAPGSSGGPLLDDNGAVVGINAATANGRYVSIATSQLIPALDALGIEYTSAGATPVVEECEHNYETAVTEPTCNEGGYTTYTCSECGDSYVADETDALEHDYKDGVCTVCDEEDPAYVSTEIEDPEEIEEPEEPKSNMLPIILIAAAAVVVIVVVVVVIVLVNGKKKKAKAAPAPVPAAVAPRQTPVAPRPTPSSFTPPAPVPGATVPMPNAGETTVLNQDAGETTVLSRNMINGGTLIRKRNGDNIRINAETFVIGRERKNVNYCISDNSSISRTHVKLVVRGGVTYLVDMRAANGTFVNGVKAMPNQEIALKNGDKITLADEDLEFRI